MSNNAPDYEDNLFFEPKGLEQKLAHSEKMRDYTAEYVAKLEEKIRNQSIQLTRLEKKNNNKSENLKNLTYKHNKLKHFNKELYHKLKDFNNLEEKLRMATNAIEQALKEPNLMDAGMLMYLTVQLNKIKE